MKVVRLYEHEDPRVIALANAIEDIIYERGKEMPVATVLGTLEIVKLNIWQDQSED